MSSSKPKGEAKVPVLKGQEVDVAANLKGAVPKTQAQKILVALAEKGQLVQKTYGKTTFFVVNQATLDSVSVDKLAALEAEQKTIDEENKLLTAELRTASLELTKLKTAPSDEKLACEITDAEKSVATLLARLKPLRSGAPMISAADLAQVDADWIKWRAEWVKRRKVFTTFWQLATDALPPQDATNLAEDLGVEVDTGEHVALERTPLCSTKSANPLKRKR
ncbi:hypothetical protein DXG03_004056 [Asterophora parasitica]|uniref:Homologous-pairing protein 2 winged helix domain-containing protein n=1 Tax=Asterophora parasitica TaxID=117018 RepID=A0A9P7KEC3_9AGAR|nr:hypothetical protein DXG03_004056 [Asterophora parasitica]